MDADDSNHYNYSKDSNSYNHSTDTTVSSRNLETVMDKSTYVVFNDTIMCNQDLLNLKIRSHNFP